MKKTATAFALVFLLLGIHPLFAADPERSSLPFADSRPSLAARAENTARLEGGTASTPGGAPPHGVVHWPRAALFREASAHPATVPETTPAGPQTRNTSTAAGIWLIALGLVAFIISRKRFNE